MTDLSEILTAFEQALILESELGTRTVDIDRTLLVPIVAKKPEREAAAAESVPAPAEKAGVTHKPEPVPDAEKLIAAPSCVDCKCVCVGEGKTNSPDFMFIGDFPADDGNGNVRPFAGAEGELIEKIITAGMKYSPEDIFITTVCKRRTQNNRMPSANDLGDSIKVLKRQISEVHPRIIMLFGKDAMNSFPLSQRMQPNMWYEYSGIPVVAVLHPREILRFRAEAQKTRKIEVWNTLKAALKKLK